MTDGNMVCPYASLALRPPLLAATVPLPLRLTLSLLVRTASQTPALAGEARLRQAPDAEPGDLEQVAGAELRPDFGSEHVVDGRVLHPRHRRDVDLVQPVAAEGEARDVADRHADPPFERAVRSIAAQVAAHHLS